MIDLFKLIIITTIWVLGLTAVTQQGMLFYSLRQWGETQAKLGKKWVEPVFLCHWCMASVHSLFGYLFAYLTGIVNFFPAWSYVFMYPLVVMGSSLSAGLIWGWYKRVEIQTELYDKQEKLCYWETKDRNEQFNRRKNRHNG